MGTTNPMGPSWSSEEHNYDIQPSKEDISTTALPRTPKIIKDDATTPKPQGDAHLQTLAFKPNVVATPLSPKRQIVSEPASEEVPLEEQIQILTTQIQQAMQEKRDQIQTKREALLRSKHEIANEVRDAGKELQNIQRLAKEGGAKIESSLQDLSKSIRSVREEIAQLEQQIFTQKQNFEQANRLDDRAAEDLAEAVVEVEKAQAGYEDVLSAVIDTYGGVDQLEKLTFDNEEEQQILEDFKSEFTQAVDALDLAIEDCEELRGVVTQTQQGLNNVKQALDLSTQRLEKQKTELTRLTDQQLDQGPKLLRQEEALKKSVGDCETALKKAETERETLKNQQQQLEETSQAQEELFGEIVEGLTMLEYEEESEKLEKLQGWLKDLGIAA